MNSFMNDLLRSYQGRIGGAPSSFVSESKLVVVHLVDDNARRHSCPAELCRNDCVHEIRKQHSTTMLVNARFSEEEYSEQKTSDSTTCTSTKSSDGSPPKPPVSSPFGERSLSSTSSTSSLSTAMASPDTLSTFKFSARDSFSLSTSPSKVSLLVTSSHQKTTARAVGVKELCSCSSASTTSPYRMTDHSSSCDDFLEAESSYSFNDPLITGPCGVLHEAEKESSESSTSTNSAASVHSLESTQMLLDAAIRVSESMATVGSSSNR